MRAALLFRLKYKLEDGAIVEMVIWSVPERVSGSSHSFKYRLHFGRGSERTVGYDNERGKGDHRHIWGREIPYRFESPEKLIADFLADVEEAQKRR
jgi:hypothetical protein